MVLTYGCRGQALGGSGALCPFSKTEVAASSRIRISPATGSCLCFLRNNNIQTRQTVAIAPGWLPELEGQILLLMTLHPLIVSLKGIKLVLTWKPRL